MEALYNMAKRITEMRQGQVLFTTMSENPALKNLVTYLNTEKQLQFGLRSDDTVLPNYPRTSIEVYGKPDAPIMLKDTGEFWRSFEVVLDADGFNIHILLDLKRNLISSQAELKAKLRTSYVDLC